MTGLTERITHNELRIAKIKGRIYTDKLTVKALENENLKSLEAMNNLTKVVDTSKTDKDILIFNLKNKVKNLTDEVERLKIDKKQLELDLLEIKNKKCDLSLVNDDLPEDNIFIEILKED